MRALCGQQVYGGPRGGLALSLALVTLSTKLTQTLCWQGPCAADRVWRAGP